MSSRGSITVWRLTWKSFVSNIENTLQNFRSSATPYWRQRRVFKRGRGCTGLLGPSPKSAPASGYLLSQNFENRAGVFIIVEVETVCGDANLSPNLVKQDFQPLTVATSPETCASGPVLGPSRVDYSRIESKLWRLGLRMVNSLTSPTSRPMALTVLASVQYHESPGTEWNGNIPAQGTVT